MAVLCGVVKGGVLWTKVLMWLRAVVTSSGCEGPVCSRWLRNQFVHGGCYEEFLAGFDPDYSPHELCHEPRVPHVRLGPSRRPLAGAAL